MINLAVCRSPLSGRPLGRMVRHAVLPRQPLGVDSPSTLPVQNSSGSFAQAGWVAGAYMAACAVGAALVGQFEHRCHCD